MDLFMKVSNFKKSLEAFQIYLKNEYNVDLSKYPNITKETLLYDIMKDMQRNQRMFQSYSLNELNNVALNSLRDVVLIKLNIPKNKKTNVQNVVRDEKLFGKRQVRQDILMPINTTMNESIDKSFEMLVKNRQITDPTKPNEDILKGVSEQCLNIDDFQKNLALLEQSRNDHLITSIDIKENINIENSDPKSLYSNSLSTSTINSNPLPFQETTIIPQNKKVLLHKYIIINGFDRNWNSYPQRFAYSVDFTKLTRVYKNVVDVRFTSIIIPMEIDEQKSILFETPKQSFNHEFKLDFPYLMLQVNELQDQYDGLNQQVQRCHTVFIYESCFRSKNGRGYIVMRPIQNDTKTNHVSVLQSLQNLSFRFVKPNGALFNQSKDHFKIIKVDWTSFNTRFLQIVLDKYYDKNEFYKGDTVLIKNMEFDAYVDIGLKHFLMRNEGHEILELGEFNESGYTNNFYVEAPANFDDQTGKKILDVNMLETLKTYNQNNPININNVKLIGSIINMSLQNVISMTLDLSIDDVKKILNS